VSQSIATTDLVTGLLELFVYGGALILALITCFKGKYGFGVLAMVTYVFGIVGAIRLAKPDSPWARRFYSAEKMKLAMERFPENAEGVELDPEKRTSAPYIARWIGALALAVAAAIGAAHR
jgi:hypothetical protein